MKVELICQNPKCKKPFTREAKEHARSVRRNRVECCSRSCAGVLLVGKFGTKVNRDWTKLNPGNRRDEFTGLRYYLRKTRERGLEGITLSDIKDQWDKQDGKCAYLGIDLILNTNKPNNNIPRWKLASLDRIDSRCPYQKGNIQFVSLPINYLKSQMSDTETREVLHLIKTNFNGA